MPRLSKKLVDGLKPRALDECAPDDPILRYAAIAKHAVIEMHLSGGVKEGDIVSETHARRTS